MLPQIFLPISITPSPWLKTYPDDAEEKGKDELEDAASEQVEQESD